MEEINNYENMSIECLIDNLNEERRKVMFELLQEPVNEQIVQKELCHEAIINAIVD